MPLPTIFLLALVQISLVLAYLPPNYEKQTASAKQEILWGQLRQSPYPAGRLPVEGPSALQAAQLLVPTFLKGSFNCANDEMDYDSRKWKIIHTFGTCAKATLRPFANSTYTGVFKSGAPGIIRLSAVRIVADNMIPSMGFKALIDGVPSANFHNVFSPDGQGLNKNFFANNVSNIIPDSQQTPLQVVAVAFTATLRILSIWPSEQPEDANSMPLYEQSSIETSGKVVPKGKVYAPWRIDYVPNPAIGYSPNATEDFRVKIAETPVGSVLYTLVAYWTRAQAEAKTGGVAIGELVLDSNFIASAYCDQGLFLNHASKRWQKE
ncbi:hypothetical protein BV898_11440 [Hypsibius exemplaris]|uniref:Uncharacterized protein n=1 Tax=Hypsibius exemplaris TaxID=2072580 RepID=A0A1W0WGJ0_HYPEX|nr:hypothetical protein BV898_11440 [Hypsibius exemplaris]